MEKNKERFLTWTYRQLNMKAENLASSLSARGIRAGMRLAVFLPNGAECAMLFWASLKLGTIFVSLDERTVTMKDTVCHYLDVVRPAALFVSNAAAARMLLKHDPARISTSRVKTLIDAEPGDMAGWERLEHLVTGDARMKASGTPCQDELIGHAAELKFWNVSDTAGCKSLDQAQDNLNTIIYIMFTSGSTGLPKACPVINKNIWARLVASKQSFRVDHTSKVVVNASAAHTMGIFYMLRTWISGGTVVLPSPTFDAKVMLETIKELGCTHTSGTPTMLLALLNHIQPGDTRSLQTIVLSGTVIPPNVAAAATDPMLLGASELISSYGTTEGMPVFSSSSNQGMKVDHGAVCLGKAHPGVRVRICEHQSRRIVARGETGELHFGGDMVISAYLSDETQSFYDDEMGHWIRSGDEAMMDSEGNIFIPGRYKDIIIRGGENISPAPIETCLGRAGVVGQVVGVPDDVDGEIPLAIIQTANHDQIPKTEIHASVVDALGPSSLPAAYATLNELGLQSFPQTASGKVLKSELTKIYALKQINARVNEYENS